MSRLVLKLFAAALLLPPLTAAGPRAQDDRSGDCGLPVQSRKFDEYGDLSADEEKARVRKLAAALKAEPEDTKAFIIAYAGRKGVAGDAIKRADRARQALTEGSFDSFLWNPRVNTLECGRRETAVTEVWLTPAGAAPPRCTPTLGPPPAPTKGAAPVRLPRRRGGRL